MNSTNIICLLSFLTYLVALALFLAGFGGNYWLSKDTMALQSRWGLWNICTKEPAEDWECITIVPRNTEDLFQVCISFMITALVFAIAAGATRVFVPVSSALEIAAGVCAMIGVTIYAGEADQQNIAQHLDWSFGLATTGGIMFTLNGIFLAILACNTGCSMSRQLPCEYFGEPTTGTVRAEIEEVTPSRKETDETTFSSKLESQNEV